MIKYRQTIVNNKSIYEKLICDGTGKTISSRKVFYPIHYITRKDKKYILLYDDSGQIIHQSFKYLNCFKLTSYNTKLKAANAIRLLYCFLELTCCDINNINETVFNELKMFLLGIGENSCNPIRSPQTVNSFFSIYRDYFEFCNIKCKPIFTKQNLIDFESKALETRYKSNLRVNNINFDTVPKYILDTEFKSLVNYFDELNDTQSIIMISLMWVYGLRLGEVLGLTYEDIVEEPDSDGKVQSYLYIRNRISDKRFQFAKNQIHPLNKNVYFSKMYRKACDKIAIDYQIFETIWNFIEKNHSMLRHKYLSNFNTTIADNVNDSDIKNHYLFLNKYGKLLSDQTWNNCLKRAFIKLGIQIDKKTKSTNLSHRFRHGFAMYHAHYSTHKLNALQLQKLMRHKSINSTTVYFNLPNKDKKIICDDFVNFIYEKINGVK